MVPSSSTGAALLCQLVAAAAAATEALLPESARSIDPARPVGEGNCWPDPPAAVRPLEPHM
jgi:hypothetical protein